MEIPFVRPSVAHATLTLNPPLIVLGFHELRLESSRMLRPRYRTTGTVCIPPTTAMVSDHSGTVTIVVYPALNYSIQQILIGRCSYLVAFFPQSRFLPPQAAVA
jgi:hypothetical protein